LSEQTSTHGILEDRLEAATEVEVEPGSHAMEEAILATLAAGGRTPEFHVFAQACLALPFTRGDLAAVAKALGTLYRQGTPADLGLIRDTLRESGARVAEEVLVGILDGSKVKLPAVAIRYVERLAGNAKIRQLEALNREFQADIEDAKNAADATAAFSRLVSRFWELAETRNLNTAHPTEADTIGGFLDSLKTRWDSKRAWSGLDSGFKHLNEVLNGLGEGLFILAGAPSTGKTTLAKQIADHVAAKEKVPVLFWSYEQSAEELRIKSLARLALVNARTIWTGRAEEKPIPKSRRVVEAPTANETWQRIKDAADKYRRGPGPWLHVIEGGREDHINAIQAAAISAQQRAGGGPVFVVVDYLQIIPGGPDAPDTIRERIDYVLSALRRMARTLHSPVLVISAENRAAYAGNAKPTLAALKESGGIEYSADAVMCLWRETTEESRQGGGSPICTHLMVLKNRNGELKRIELEFTPAFAEFKESVRSDNVTWQEALG